MFYRRLVNRGGENLSSQKRNCLILQCVNLFAVPQELYDNQSIIKNIQDCIEYNNLPSDILEDFIKIKTTVSKK